MCNEASPVRFAWGVLDLRIAGGMPAKDVWALLSPDVLGDDGTVARLVPLIRTWPGQSQHHNAVNGLDVLARVGTDVALIGIAQRVKFKALEQRVTERISDIAE
ncbi:hypothetical protein LV78_002715 [Actinosynnema pretiosum]|nr:hypothetical protein [Actinosynnema pretiosum]